MYHHAAHPAAHHAHSGMASFARPVTPAQSGYSIPSGAVTPHGQVRPMIHTHGSHHMASMAGKSSQPQMAPIMGTLNGSSPTSTIQTPKMATQTVTAGDVADSPGRSVRGEYPVTQYSSQVVSGTSGNATISAAQTSSRTQMLEQRVRELELQVSQKDAKIQELEAALYAKTGAAGGAKKTKPVGSRTRTGFRAVTDSKPVAVYTAADPDDVVDVRLEEFYNTTGSAIPFKRVNKGFYRFGNTIVELDIINHKLMARTEDHWNRGKFGPIEKFIMYYENIEREKAGIPIDS